MQQETPVTATFKDTSHPVLTIRGKPVNPWLVLISLVFGFFMSLLDITIVNIAIPSIQSSLNTNLTTVTWVLNAYSLVFAILLVTMGRFADQFGRKRIFMMGTATIGVGVRTTATTMCGVGTHSATHPYEKREEDWLSKAYDVRFVGLDVTTARQMSAASSPRPPISGAPSTGSSLPHCVTLH
jgi:hypothetical protein